MDLIRWEPLGEIERFFESGWPRLSSQNLGLDLSVDLYEEGDNLVAKMQLPGIEAKNIDVSVEDQVLRVKGKREEEKEEKKKNYYSKEIRRGSFERAVRLPKPVVVEKTTANHKDGVLVVTMPKKAEAKGGKVKVNVK